MKPTTVFFGTHIVNTGRCIEVVQGRRLVRSVGNIDFCIGGWDACKWENRNNADF